VWWIIRWIHEEGKGRLAHGNHAGLRIGCVLRGCIGGVDGSMERRLGEPSGAEQSSKRSPTLQVRGWATFWDGHEAGSRGPFRC
jgi:hypothetical protein